MIEGRFDFFESLKTRATALTTLLAVPPPESVKVLTKVDNRQFDALVLLCKFQVDSLDTDDVRLLRRTVSSSSGYRSTESSVTVPVEDL